MVRAARRRNQSAEAGARSGVNGQNRIERGAFGIDGQQTAGLVRIGTPISLVGRIAAMTVLTRLRRRVYGAENLGVRIATGGRGVMSNGSVNAQSRLAARRGGLDPTSRFR